VKIRTEDGQVFHLNDYHFITLYRNVHADNIHGSDTEHLVLLYEFRDWNGLAAAAVKSSKFDFDRVSWGKKTTASGTEIYLADGGNTVWLTGKDIQTLSSYLNDDVRPPNEARTQGFDQALSEIELVKNKKIDTDLCIQWPAKLPKGLKPEEGKEREDHYEYFLLGPTGHLEYPHIHFFIKPDHYIYYARATLAPRRGQQDKRGFALQNNLTFVREGTQATDEQPLLDMEKVVRHLVSGEDLVIAETKPTKKKGAKETDPEPADPSVAYYESYAVAWNVSPEWIADVFPATGLDLNDLGEYSPHSLVTLANVLQGNDFVEPRTAWEEKNNGGW
jgi:hypothetical protein